MPNAGAKPDHCALCARPALLSFHHLIPRKNHRKSWYLRHFTRDEMRLRGVWLCRLCHAAVHRQFDEQELGRRLNTVEALMQEPAIRKHVAWARRQTRQQ